MTTLANSNSFMVVYLSDLVLCPVIFVLFCLFKRISQAKITGKDRLISGCRLSPPKITSANSSHENDFRDVSSYKPITFHLTYLKR